MDEHTKNESEPKYVEFSEIVKIEEGKTKSEIKFILENGEIITENIHSCSKFVEPSYDSVFKTIFGDGNFINEKEGKDRLINLLNSLIFPNEESKIIDINSISNEKSKIKKDQDNSGIMRFDISCKATVLDKKKKTTKIIDVEMQNGKKTNILLRMDNYAYALYQTYQMETVVIAFMNQDYINNENRSQIVNRTVYDNEGKIIRKENGPKVIIINLKEEIKKIQKKGKIKLDEKELDKVGISWLKLLGIRQWAKTVNNFYYLPKNVHFLSKELESAFILLQSYDEGELIRLLRKEEEDRNILNIYEENGEKKGKMEQILGSLLNVFEQKKESFDEMIDIIDYEQSIFNTEDIEKKIPDENKRNKFLELLGKKRKIE